MTFRKWSKLYGHYKRYYDFTLSKVSYERLSQAQTESDEWLPD